MNRPRLRSQRAFAEYTRQHTPQPVAAKLGNQQGVVDHPTRGTGWVYAQLLGDQNRLIVASDERNRVAHRAGIVVAVEWTGAGHYRVASLYPGIYPDNVWATTVGYHAGQHVRRDLGGGGPDPVDVTPRMVVPLRARAQLVPDLTVHVDGGFVPGTSLQLFAGGDSPALSAVTTPVYNANVRWDLLYLLVSNLTLQIVEGAEVSAATDPDDVPLPVCPPGVCPLAFIWRYSGQVAIEENCFFDARGLGNVIGSAETPSTTTIYYAHNLAAGVGFLGYIQALPASTVGAETTAGFVDALTNAGDPGAGTFPAGVDMAKFYAAVTGPRFGTIRFRFRVIVFHNSDIDDYDILGTGYSPYMVFSAATPATPYTLYAEVGTTPLLATDRVCFELTGQLLPGSIDPVDVVFYYDGTDHPCRFYTGVVNATPPHHASHEPGGSDAMAVDAAAATGSLRTLGTGATQAAAGDHTHSGLGPFPLDPYTENVTEDGYTGEHINPNQYRTALASVVIGGTTYQAITYWDADGHLVIGKRVLDGAWTLYTMNGSGGRPDLHVAGGDNHNTASIGLDPNGYLHVAYDMHAAALKYRKSTAAINAWTGGLTAALAMLGTNESAVTYPQFYNDPSGALYFVFRDGESGNGDLFIYKYNHAATTWGGVAGTVAGKVISGKTSAPHQNPYWSTLAFDDDFGSGGYLHLSWVWRASGLDPDDHDLSYVKWDETNWKQADGSAQTMPITLANAEIVDAVAAGNGLTAFNSMSSDSAGHPHLVYPKVGTDGYRHLYHAYYSSAAWVVRQLTASRRPNEGDAAVPFFLAAALAIDRGDDTVYVFYLDDLDREGLLVLQSAPGDYTTWTRGCAYPRDPGWWAPSFDAAEWERDTLLYFPVAYWVGGLLSSPETQLPIRMLTWDPATDWSFEAPVDGHDHSDAWHGGAVGHASLSGVTENQHHARIHAIDGSSHSAAGLTAGQVLTATSPTTVAFRDSAGGGSEPLVLDGDWLWLAGDIISLGVS